MTKNQLVEPPKVQKVLKVHNKFNKQQSIRDLIQKVNQRGNSRHGSLSKNSTGLLKNFKIYKGEDFDTHSRINSSVFK